MLSWSVGIAMHSPHEHLRKGHKDLENNTKIQLMKV